MQGSRNAFRLLPSWGTFVVTLALASVTGCGGTPDRGNGTSPSGGAMDHGGAPGTGGGTGTGGAAGEASGGTTAKETGGSGGNESGGTTAKPSGGSGGRASGGAGGSASGGTTVTAGGGAGGSASGGTTVNAGGGAGGSASGGTTVNAGGGAGGSASGGSTVNPSGGAGGKTGSGGATSGTGGTAPGSGGRTGLGGATGSGGATGTAGSSGPQGPCDIYAAASTPCVSAHSTVRALYAAYSGPLYQVRKSSGTQDIPVDGPGGFVKISVQDSFCSGTTCTISVIYDQSPNKNDLVKSPAALWLPNGGMEANATQGKITISGHTAYGIYVDNSGGSTGVGYRNNACKGLATGDDAESMYMVVDGKRFNQWCCFDYGNAETNGSDAGNATMECLYWGNSTQWTTGSGSGPWMAADLENGMFECDSKTSCPTNTSVTGMSFVVGVLKGPSGNSMGIKAGNAQSGKLETKFNGKRPSGYSPMKKQGAIILGTGGDGSNNAKGTFFEGAITKGNPPDATDDLVQANIVAAGYGK
jgi:hypothetical protein